MTVPPNHIGLVEIFEEFNRILLPGLHLVTPFLEHVLLKLTWLYATFLDVEAIPQDKVKVSVKVKANIIHKTDREYVTEYYYNLTDQKHTLASFVENYDSSNVTSPPH